MEKLLSFSPFQSPFRVFRSCLDPCAEVFYFTFFFLGSFILISEELIAGPLTATPTEKVFMFSFLILKAAPAIFFGVIPKRKLTNNKNQKVLLFHLSFSAASWTTLAINWLQLDMGNGEISITHLTLLQLSFFEQIIAQTFNQVSCCIKVVSLLVYFSLEITMLFFSKFQGLQQTSYASLAIKVLLILAIIGKFKSPNGQNKLSFAQEEKTNQKTREKTKGDLEVQGNFKETVNSEVKHLKELKKTEKQEEEHSEGPFSFKEEEEEKRETRKQLKESHFTFHLRRSSSFEIGKGKNSRVLLDDCFHECLPVLNSIKSRSSLQKKAEFVQKEGEKLKRKEAIRPSIDFKLPSKDILTLSLYSKNRCSSWSLDNKTDHSRNHQIRRVCDWLPFPSFVLRAGRSKVVSFNRQFQEKFDINLTQKKLEVSTISWLIGDLKTPSYQGTTSLTVFTISSKVLKGELTSSNFPMLLRADSTSNHSIKGINELDIWMQLFYENGCPFILAQVIESVASDSISQLRDEIMNSFTHEFKTPLNIIKTTFSMLLKDKEFSGLFDSEFKNNFLVPSHESTKLLMALISSIGNHSAILSKTYQPKATEKNIKSFLNQTLKLFRNKAKEKEVELKLKGNETLPLTWVTDWNLVQQVLIELISNSLKFSKPNGFISIECSLAQFGKLKLRVKDNGIGMTKEELQRLESYLKNDFSVRKISKNSSGIGIGMVIIRSILWGLSKENAELKIKSTKSGTSFEFIVKDMMNSLSICNLEGSLNVIVANNSSSFGSLVINTLNDYVVEEGCQAQEEGAMDIPEEYNGKGLFVPSFQKTSRYGEFNGSNEEVEKMSLEPIIICDCRRILVIDDEKSNRVVLRAHLRKENKWTDILEASNGQEALELIMALSPCKSKNCRLITGAFVDMNMPVMGGEEFCRRLRKLSKEKSMKYHVLICYTAYDFQAKYKEMGFDGFLSKPFRSSDFKELLLKHFS